MNPFRPHTGLLFGLLALVFLSLPATAANLAGTAVFVSGQATATAPDGTVRTLKARDKVYSGELLETGKGRIQVKYIDGAFMSIQPNSRFLIEDYNFENQSDGSEKAVYNLIKGGMRAFTGAIGKKHPDAYKVKTPVATIGIRGTGHNTRVCSGDCTGSDGLPLPDGLYHSTWEGTTVVANDFGITVVGAGSSVFVEGLDAPAEESGAASEVTAAQTSGDSSPTLTAGDELDGDTPVGVTIVMATTALQVTQELNQNLVGIEPNLFRNEFDPDNAEGGIVFDATVLTGADSVGTNGMIGFIGSEIDDIGDGTIERDLLVTIAPLGILDMNSTDPRVSLAQGFISGALDNATDAVLVNDVIENPATVAEFTVGTYLFNNFAFGRWTSGNILFIDKVPGTGIPIVEKDMLQEGQDLLWVFGKTADTSSWSGATGTYDVFLGGTASVDTHDGFTGNGVQSGSLAFDFTTRTGKINDLMVLHDTTYTINGDLGIATGPARFFDSGIGVSAVATGDCALGCSTFIDGSFFGGLTDAAAEGAPALAGLVYEIEKTPFNGVTGNSITGNAVFGRSGPATLVPEFVE